MAVTNKQLATMMDDLKTQIGGIDTRVLRIEGLIMNGRSNGQKSLVSPIVTLLVKWVIAPLILILGAAFGVAPNLPLGG